MFTQEKKVSPWLVSPLWDSLWLFSGLWLLSVLLVATPLGKAGFISSAFFIGGFAILWGGHILSPMLCAWSTPKLRSHLRENKFNLITIPLVILASSCALGVFSINASQPPNPWFQAKWEITGIGYLMGLTFLVWNTWHFASQHYGVLSIYRIRAKQFESFDKRFDRFFCLFMTGVLLPISWYTQSARLDMLFEYLPTPKPMGRLAITVIVISVILLAYALKKEWGRSTRSVPKLIYLTSIGVQPIFGTISYPLYHFAIFSMAHWIVAIALAARIQSNKYNQKFAVHAAFFLCLSIPMYFLFRSTYFVNWLLDVFAVNVTINVTGLLIGFAYGITFVHFIYDRYIYSFRRPEIKDSIGKHLLTI